MSQEKPASWWSEHPIAETVEQLGRCLYEEFDHASPGDMTKGWDDLRPIDKDLYITAIMNLIHTRPDLVEAVLAYDRSAT